MTKMSLDDRLDNFENLADHITHQTKIEDQQNNAWPFTPNITPHHLNQQNNNENRNQQTKNRGQQPIYGRQQEGYHAVFSSTCYDFRHKINRYIRSNQNIVHISPFLDVRTVPSSFLGNGVYGMTILGQNSIYIRDDLYNPAEVDYHEHIHANNPNLSEYLVRLIIRTRQDKTIYH